KRPIAEDKLTAFEKTLVKQVESVRIIRKNEIYYELAHDTLAVIINNKRDAEQRLIKSLVQNLQTSYFFYKKEKGSLLSEQSVALYDRFKNAIDDTLSHSEEKTALFLFIENSRKENTKEKEELEKKNKRLRNLLAGVIVLIGIIVAVFVIAYRLVDEEKNNADKAKNNAENSLKKYNQTRAGQLLIDAQTFLESNDTVLAKGKIRQAYTLDTNSVSKSKLKWLLTSK
nr:hypothetical protein [Flectobacillus sp.]